MAHAPALDRVTSLLYRQGGEHEPVCNEPTTGGRAVSFERRRGGVGGRVEEGNVGKDGVGGLGFVVDVLVSGGGVGEMERGGVSGFGGGFKDPGDLGTELFWSVGGRTAARQAA